MERLERIELSSSAWKAEVLPLNYRRIVLGVEEEGLEPSGGRRLFMYHTKEESNLNPIPISSVFLLVLDE